MGLEMDEKDKKEFLEDFKKSEGSKRLDMWDYALGQQVFWEQIITELSVIAKEQGVDKELEKMFEEEMKKGEE